MLSEGIGSQQAAIEGQLMAIQNVVRLALISFPPTKTEHPGEYLVARGCGSQRLCIRR